MDVGPSHSSDKCILSGLIWSLTECFHLVRENEPFKAKCKFVFWANFLTFWIQFVSVPVSCTQVLVSLWWLSTVWKWNCCSVLLTKVVWRQSWRHTKCLWGHVYPSICNGWRPEIRVWGWVVVYEVRVATMFVMFSPMVHVPKWQNSKWNLFPTSSHIYISIESRYSTEESNTSWDMYQ